MFKSFRTAALACAVACAAQAASAAPILYSQFLFDNGLTDTLGNSTATGVGTVSGSSYTFSRGNGLTVVNTDVLSSFTILLGLTVNLDGPVFNKLMDFSGLTSDSGYYLKRSDGVPYETRFAGVIDGPGSIAPGGTKIIGLSYDQGTDSVTMFMEGAPVVSFVDTGDAVGALSGVSLMIDDAVSSGTETTSGSLSFVEIWDGAMTQTQFDAVAGPASVVPVPAPALMLLTALGGLRALRRRR